MTPDETHNHSADNAGSKPYLLRQWSEQAENTKGGKAGQSRPKRNPDTSIAEIVARGHWPSIGRFGL
jgi:hypothetical protein